MEKIVVIGASKGIGRETVKALLTRGYAVVAFARSAEHIDIIDDNLTLVNGDATNPKDVDAALEGVDAVVLALGIPMSTKFLTGPITLFSRATETLLPLMKAREIKRLVAVTGFGAGDSKQAISCLQKLPFKIVFSHVYSDKTRQEELIKQSDLDWTLVRPGILYNGALRAGGYAIRYSPSEWRNGPISRTAVADYIGCCINDAESIGKEPVLAG